MFNSSLTQVHEKDPEKKVFVLFFTPKSVVQGIDEVGT
jgi:hypothetical protein